MRRVGLHGGHSRTSYTSCNTAITSCAVETVIVIRERRELKLAAASNTLRLWSKKKIGNERRLNSSGMTGRKREQIRS